MTDRFRRLRGRPAAAIARLVLLLAALVPLAGLTTQQTDIRNRYYTISGASRAELLASIRSNGPRNGHAYGIGFIDFLPRYSVQTTNGLCHVASAAVGVRATLRLPRWEGPRDAPNAVSRVAAHFVRSIAAHELHHVAISRRYADRMQAALLALKPDSHCWTIREAARTTIDRLKTEHRRAQTSFDGHDHKHISGLL